MLTDTTPIDCAQGTRMTEGPRMSTSPAPAPTPGSPAAPSVAPWEELVTVALLGTDRRTPPGPASGREAPAALLDIAAVETVRRRAGLRPARAAARPEPAAADPRPQLPPAAARRLSMLLADRPGTGGGGRRGAAPDLMELLPQWLSLANARGFAAPPQTLPTLLDAARGRTDLRPAVLAFAGPRALWLARLNPDWRFALRAAPGGGAELPLPQESDRIRQLWQEGLFAERVALLTTLRAQSPETARELLATTWATERAEDRLMFLDSLRAGLAAADEPFLEQSLSDRSRNVRATAAELLSALPESALAGRMADRAGSCVAVDRTRRVPTLVVEAPHECDAGMERDGVVAKAPAGRGERSWWLGQLVEAAPLGTWQNRLGGVRRRRWSRCRWRTTGGASSTRRGAGRRYGSGTPAGPGRCWGRRRPRRPEGRGRCRWRSGRSCWRRWVPRSGRTGSRGSSPRTGCRRRFSCSGCVRCRGRRRWGGQW
ncbi:hypothetical protein SAV31267_059560 [Streptomyces avermitilis]|uniref:Uncharacterized protein n=1 Tax=Streptomyces avermitilis TaxID=33903 RepID=A0A4D4MWB2_STRAX|nr:hypothetical protein SAV31267_059560 [Streptomyces avermitilis]